MRSGHTMTRPAHHPLWLLAASSIVVVGLLVWVDPAMLRHIVSPSETLPSETPLTMAPPSPTSTPEPTPTVVPTATEHAPATVAPTARVDPTPARTPAETDELAGTEAAATREAALSDTVPPRSMDQEPAPHPAGRLALTFDCGYNVDSLTRILAMLAEHEARATFFFEGTWVGRTPAVISMTLAGGHEVGSHSYSHPNFTTLTQAEVNWELDMTASLIARAGGPVTTTLFRYPYGAHTFQTDSWVLAKGYQIVDWSIDPKGWSLDTSSQDVIDHVRMRAKPGGIVLMHCGSTTDKRALDQVIRDLHAAGYELVTVSELPPKD